MTIRRVKGKRDEIHFEFGKLKFEMSLLQIVAILAIIGVIVCASLNMNFSYTGQRISFGCTPVELPRK